MCALQATGAAPLLLLQWSQLAASAPAGITWQQGGSSSSSSRGWCSGLLGFQVLGCACPASWVSGHGTEHLDAC
jgi:hypothetical protein